MKRIFRTVQFLSHVAMIFIALMIGFVVIKRYVLAPPTFVTTTGPQNAEPPYRTAGQTISAPLTPVGKPIPLEGVNWREKMQTVVLYLSATCRYCNESVPFYQRLIKEKSKQDFEIVAVLSQNPEEAENYLKSKDMDISQVYSSSLSSIGITSTPTLLLVNQEGVVSDFWRGKLKPDKEAEVLAKLAG